jgi:hypothetical protein
VEWDRSATLAELGRISARYAKRVGAAERTARLVSLPLRTEALR